MPAKATLRIHMPTPANANAPQFRGAAPDDPDKEDDLTYDVGNLACFDTHPISLQEVNAQGGLSSVDKFLIKHARDNAQLLFNQIFNLETEASDVGRLAVLPEGETLAAVQASAQAKARDEVAKVCQGERHQKQEARTHALGRAKEGVAATLRLPASERRDRLGDRRLAQTITLTRTLSS